MVANIPYLGPQTLVVVRDALRRKGKILKQIGIILEKTATRAFLVQQLGTYKWEPRYPNQIGPFINIAGALQDFTQGAAQPKMRRFDRIPALKDSDELSKSPRARIVGADEVEVGSSLPYADRMHRGGEGQQVVTDAAKELMRAWIETPRGAVYSERMAPLLRPATNIWTTTVVARPIFGLTDLAKREIVDVIERGIASEAAGP